MSEAIELLKVLALLKKQANDGGLWAEPYCLSEKYMQGALRELHTAMVAYFEMIQKSLAKRGT